MAESSKVHISKEQESNLNALKEKIRNQTTSDMMRLVKMPEFLRYIGRWTKHCGVHSAIEGSQTNDVLRREGARGVGELMLKELKAVNLEAAFEMERMSMRLEQHRIDIKNNGAKLDYGFFLDK